MTIKQTIEELNQLAENFKNQAQEKLKEAFKIFWDENPEVHLIVWSQYAPYFNDGETCEFSVNDPCFSNSLENEQCLAWGQNSDSNEYVWSCWAKKGKPFNYEMAKDLGTLITSNNMENIMKLMFGDGSIVFARREGFTIEAYDHE